jgi:hypothetical protein
MAVRVGFVVYKVALRQVPLSQYHHLTFRTELHVGITLIRRTRGRRSGNLKQRKALPNMGGGTL